MRSQILAEIQGNVYNFEKIGTTLRTFPIVIRTRKKGKNATRLHQGMASTSTAFVYIFPLLKGKRENKEKAVHSAELRENYDGI